MTFVELTLDQFNRNAQAALKAQAQGIEAPEQPNQQVTYQGAYIGVSTPFNKEAGDLPTDKKLKKPDNRASTRQEVEKMLHDQATQDYYAE